MAKRKTPKKESAVEKEYKRIRKNLLSTIRRAEKRGFVFPELKIPSIPKKITKASIRNLEKLTKDKYRGLYEKGRYVSPKTGKSYKGLYGRDVSRRKPERRPTKPSKPKVDVGDYFDGYDNGIDKVDVGDYFDDYDDGIDWDRIVKEKEVRSADHEYRDLEEQINELMKIPNKDSEIWGKINELQENQEIIMDKLADLDYARLYDEIKERNNEYDYQKAEQEGFQEGPGKGAPPVDSDVIFDNLIRSLDSLADIEKLKQLLKNPPQNFRGKWGDELNEDVVYLSNYVYAILMSAISRDGYDIVAQRIKDNSEEIFALVEAMQNDSKSERKQSSVSRIAEILNQHALTADESRQYTRMAEYDEDYGEDED